MNEDGELERFWKDVGGKTDRTWRWIQYGGRRGRGVPRMTAGLWAPWGDAGTFSEAGTSLDPRSAGSK